MESPTALVSRRTILSFVKLLFLVLPNVPLIRGAPTKLLKSMVQGEQEGPEPLPADDAALWIYLSVAVGLVLLGGAFAGLTIALMGQDEIYLQVIKTSGEGAEKKHAARVLRLLERGKHWVLVTLLLGNVITNETLPIVLDRSLGGGWPAVLGSTVLIVIFGEIIPQSICVRYGLPIGAWMSSLVLVLMYILSPVAWPTAKLLDRLLGEEHGTTYKKAGLKTLVTLHKTLGAAGEQLNADEVTIISAVLDLKEKPIGSIMTPMDDVFIMSADTVLDEKTMDVILSAGYSRIPIHSPDNASNFVGMLLVKILITYDPEDCKAVRDFALATLPETSPLTSCLDIVNFFQEGKSHMVLVSDFPGQNHGAIGVVTLEDVIEELIGEEIIDESDVFIDVHKAIRRTHMAPRYRMPKEKVSKGELVVNLEADAADGEENLIDLESRDGEQPPSHAAIKRLTTSEGRSSDETRNDPSLLSSSPKRSSIGRRNSSAATGSDRDFRLRREQTPEMREHLKHLGPSNLASRPRQTRYNTIKIKPGGGSFSDVAKAASKNNGFAEPTPVLKMPAAASGGVGEGLLSSAGKDASDGVHAVQTGYGTIGTPPRHPDSPVKSMKSIQAVSQKVISSSPHARSNSRPTSSGSSSSSTHRPRPFSPVKKGTVRSGSITENIIEADGIKKVVLELTSSSEEQPEQGVAAEGKEEAKEGKASESEGTTSTGGGKKKRRRKRKKTSKKAEEEPLIEADES